MWFLSTPREFSELLKALGWPVTGPRSTSSIVAIEQKKERFLLCFRHLLALDCHHQLDKTSIVRTDDPIFLPLELMLDPLRKRFKYHFYGDKKTNSKEKVNITSQHGKEVFEACSAYEMICLLLQPEWFFTQVTTWIDDHASFLNDLVQPALQGSTFAYVSAKVTPTFSQGGGCHDPVTAPHPLLLLLVSSVFVTLLG